LWIVCDDSEGLHPTISADPVAVRDFESSQTIHKGSRRQKRQERQERQSGIQRPGEVWRSWGGEGIAYRLMVS
jgi:hypothetical protein